MMEKEYCYLVWWCTDVLAGVARTIDGAKEAARVFEDDDEHVLQWQEDEWTNICETTQKLFRIERVELLP